MEGLKKSFLVRGNNIVGFSDKNFSTAPIGTVLSFAGQTAPNGYLLCNGASYKVADYPDLYAVIGNTYGGDTENFNVPNLVDKFIEGSTTSGEEKEAGLPNITGGWMPSVPVNYQNYVSGAITAETKSSGLVSSSGTQAAPGAGFKIDASKSSAVYGKSTTVQPPALTMVYIIKAFHTNEGVDSGVSDDVIKYVNNSNSYSTEETLTGGTWINGKPIYRKVIDFGTLPKNNIKKVPHGISDIDATVSINGISFTNSKTVTPIPYSHSDSTNEVSLFIEGTNICIRTFGDKTHYINTYVTLEYTKTTN